jgi:hypothetical protein
MPLADLQERINLLCPSGPPERFSIMPSEVVFQQNRPLNLNKEEDQQRIDNVLTELEARGQRPDMIVFDNLSSLSIGIDENSNSELDAQLTWFRSLRHRGYAVMLVHHTNKTRTEQRGASRREDLLDTSIRLEPIDASDKEPPVLGAKFKMVFAKTRGIMPDPPELVLELRADENGAGTWMTNRPKWKFPPRIQLLREVYENRPETQQELARPGRKAPQVSKLAKQLRKFGWLDGMKITLAGLDELRRWDPTISEDDQHDLF